MKIIIKDLICLKGGIIYAIFIYFWVSDIFIFHSKYSDVIFLFTIFIQLLWFYYVLNKLISVTSQNNKILFIHFVLSIIILLFIILDILYTDINLYIYFLIEFSAVVSYILIIHLISKNLIKLEILKNINKYDSFATYFQVFALPFYIILVNQRIRSILL